MTRHVGYQISIERQAFGLHLQTSTGIRHRNFIPNTYIFSTYSYPPTPPPFKIITTPLSLNSTTTTPTQTQTQPCKGQAHPSPTDNARKPCADADPKQNSLWLALRGMMLFPSDCGYGIESVWQAGGWVFSCIGREMRVAFGLLVFGVVAVLVSGDTTDQGLGREKN